MQAVEIFSIVGNLSLVVQTLILIFVTFIVHRNSK